MRPVQVIGGTVQAHQVQPLALLTATIGSYLWTLTARLPERPRTGGSVVSNAVRSWVLFHVGLGSPEGKPIRYRTRDNSY